MSGAVKIERKNLIDGFKIFLIFVVIAEILNIAVYNMNILNGEEFNMFYISPYFVSTLPVFNILQESLPFIVYLGVYIVAVYLGANIVYGIFKRKNKLIKDRKNIWKKYLKNMNCFLF